MIHYKNTLSGVSEDQLKGFFAGWENPPSQKTLLNLLQGSDYVVLAVDDETKNVVGFITAISDRVISAYIPFLEVLPLYQKKGIGTELAKKMLGFIGDYYMVDLLCDEEVQSFYERLGMKKTHGMMLRNYGRQSGF